MPLYFLIGIQKGKGITNGNIVGGSIFVGKPDAVLTVFLISIAFH